MVAPGRNFSAGNQYRYGFNGKELVSELADDGNQYDYGFRIYNPKIGKFLSVDPLTQSYPWYTPYQFAGNMPINSIDLDGLESKVVIHWVDKVQGDGALKITKTKTSIDKTDSWQEVDPATKNPTGHVYAVTETYYYFFNDKKLYKGKDFLEEITPDRPKPSANYDYTQNVIAGKEADDKNYAGTLFNPLNWGKYANLLARDANAPDNAMTVENVNMGMLAFTAIVGASATAKSLLKAEGIAVEGPNAAAAARKPALETEDLISVFHKGELNGGVVSSSRTLSTGLERESVEALNRTGKVWEFKIPRLQLREWENKGLVTRFKDTDHVTGVVNDELRFSGQLASDLNKFIVKPR